MASDQGSLATRPPSGRRWWRVPVRAAGATVLAAALVLLGGVALGGPGPAPARPAAPVASTSSDPLERQAARLQARVARVPGDWPAWSALGGVRLEQGRTTGDATFTSRAEEAFRRSLQVERDGNAEALAGLSAVAAVRHDFATAADLARQAVSADPYEAGAHGALFDALVELGRYEQAAAALQQMADLSPGLPALARVSYLRELHGDVDGARTALERALDAAGSTTGRVFALQQLGDLALSNGDLDAAQARYREGLHHDPDSLALQVGTARVAAARGDLEGAAQLLRTVVAAQPAPGWAAELGDLLTALGRPDEAAQQYAVVAAGHRLATADGGSADLEAALFAADHGNPAAALQAATAEHRRRQTVYTEDALAWALHRSGRSQEALPLAERALRLGTRDASLHFHLGMIRSAVGDRAGARAALERALKIDPHFSVLHAETARIELADLAAPG